MLKERLEARFYPYKFIVDEDYITINVECTHKGRFFKPTISLIESDDYKWIEKVFRAVVNKLDNDDREFGND